MTAIEKDLMCHDDMFFVAQNILTERKICLVTKSRVVNHCVMSERNVVQVPKQLNYVWRVLLT